MPQKQKSSGYGPKYFIGITGIADDGHQTRIPGRVLAFQLFLNFDVHVLEINSPNGSLKHRFPNQRVAATSGSNAVVMLLNVLLSSCLSIQCDQVLEAGRLSPLKQSDFRETKLWVDFFSQLNYDVSSKLWVGDNQQTTVVLCCSGNSLIVSNTNLAALNSILLTRNIRVLVFTCWSRMRIIKPKTQFQQSYHWRY